MEIIYNDIKEVLMEKGLTDLEMRPGLSGPVSATVSFEDEEGTFIYLRFWFNTKTIDISNISIRKDLRHTGILSNLLVYLESLEDYEVIKIENCMTEEIIKFALKNSFKSNNSDFIPSYYKRKESKDEICVGCAVDLEL